MTHYIKLAGATALSALLLATPALADFHEEWDGDADGALSEEEFGAGLGEVGSFGAWDQDDDGALNEEEYGAGVFGAYDEDDSGALEEEERVAFEEDDAGRWGADYGAWDADEDGSLSEEEFGAGFAERGGFGAWDEDDDDLVSEDEFGTGVFGGYDADRSGVIEEPELGDVGDDMGDGGLFDI